MSDTHTNDKRADDAEHVKVLGQEKQIDELKKEVGELRAALASALKASAAPTAAAAHGAPAHAAGRASLSPVGAFYLIGDYAWCC